MKLTQYSLVLLLLVSCFSCQENKRSTAEKVIREWIGKEVLLPEVPCMYMGRDTICPPPSTRPYKVLVYTDSVGCTSCQLNLGLWQIYMEDAEIVAPNQVDFLFYFQPKNEKELSYLLRRERVEHRVFVDADSRTPTAGQRFSRWHGLSVFSAGRGQQGTVHRQPDGEPTAMGYIQEAVYGVTISR